MKTTRLISLVTAALMGAFLLTASAQTTGEKVGAAASETKEKLQDAGQAVTGKLDQLWQRIDEARLKNRTRDEIVGWVIMGVVVGSVLGRVTNLKWGTAFGFGLIGSFLGGVVAHVTQLDLGLGPVLIRYEDLLCALTGAAVVLLVVRSVMAKRKLKKEEK